MSELFDPSRVEAALGDRLTRVNDLLSTLLPSMEPMSSRVNEAMHYSLMAGGKRLRPLLVVLACEACEPPAERVDAAFRVGCAWEFVHTYSLIHDDLPALDNDDLRRGMPTCHKQFDEVTAILAGDALHAHAFEVVAGHAPTAELARDIVLLLSRNAGVPGMVGGQMADILGEAEGEGAVPSLEQVEFIHLRKTTALIRSAVQAGAMIGGASGPALDAMTRYGEAIGLAFQIADDILDCTSTAEQLGKTPGKDAAAGKLTYVAVMGMDGARAEADRLVTTALRALTDSGLTRTEILADLARYIIHRTH